MKQACKKIAIASCITAIGIVHVVGLLAARPYIVHSSQYLGIKAQHAVPLLIVTLAALMGGVALPGEKMSKYADRAKASLQDAMSEPARFGTLLFGLVTLAALALIIARTGNDAGVGVSGIELKARAILDRIMPVRPRTKEFLVGHPAFVLGICWWLRGRRKVAIPAFVIGSLGQVSLLNTFCHIHTPLIISAWRGGTGLVVGTVIGLAIFALGERLLREPNYGPSPPH
jgi:Na+/proline symporter